MSRGRETWQTVKANCEWVIYILRCPDSKIIRYVGWTVDLVNRLAVHRYRARTKRKTYCERWINGLLTAGKEPDVEVVEHGKGPWEQTEQRWIRHFRALGMPLTNLTTGGEGCIGFKHSKATCNEMRVRKYRPWTPEEKERARQRMLGRVFTPEWKQKIRQAKLKENPARGKKLSKELIEKMRAGMKAHYARKKAGKTGTHPL